jgi:hypothetical protein
MSAMLCNECSGLVDTDADADSLYVEGYDCLCKACRHSMNKPSEFEREGER